MCLLQVNLLAYFWSYLTKTPVFQNVGEWTERNLELMKNACAKFEKGTATCTVAIAKKDSETILAVWAKVNDDLKCAIGKLQTANSLTSVDVKAALAVDTVALKAESVDIAVDTGALAINIANLKAECAARKAKEDIQKVLLDVADLISLYAFYFCVPLVLAAPELPDAAAAPAELQPPPSTAWARFCEQYQELSDNLDDHHITHQDFTVEAGKLAQYFFQSSTILDVMDLSMMEEQSIWNEYGDPNCYSNSKNYMHDPAKDQLGRQSAGTSR